MSKENSFIQLVRAIAEEVFEKKCETTEELEHRVDKLEENFEDRIDKIESELEEIDTFNDEAMCRFVDLENKIGKGFVTEDVKESIKNIKNSLDDISGTWNSGNRMSGSVWSTLEEGTLKKEIKATITAIAANHGRTEKAIKARLKKMDVLDYLDY